MTRRSLLLALLQPKSTFVATRVRPSQIRNWRQVSPTAVGWRGAGLNLQQVQIDKDVLAAWQECVQRHDRFEVAVTKDQPAPILIAPAPFMTTLPGAYSFWFRK
jgi:hypothetical protein